MKNIFLFSAATLLSFTTFAQGVTSLHENFDVDCVLSGEISSTSGWTVYTKESGNIPSGQWTCTPTLGRPNASNLATPGIMCSDYFSGQYHLDSSFLITPLLNLTSFTDSAYLQFDIKASNIYLGANVTILLSDDSSIGALTSVASDSNLGPFLTPLLGVIDSGQWITHQVNITRFKSNPFYIAFLYVTASNTGATWYLDNVNISTTRLGVPDITENKLPLTVTGYSTPDNIDLTFTTAGEGNYQLSLTDMPGKLVYSSNRNFTPGKQTISMDGLGLKPGMYFIKISNGSEMGIAKVVIH